MNVKQVLSRFETENNRFIIGKCFKYSNRVLGGYRKFFEDDNILLYKANRNEAKIQSAYGTTIVKFNGRVITIYPNYKNLLIKYCVKFNSKNFPGLIKDSTIVKILVIPFLREVETDKFFKRYRTVIFTDKCQIYHNFPVRDNDCDGYEIAGDIKRFEESVVWDIPGRKYPTKNDLPSISEYYYPFLPDESYCYFPQINQKSKYSSRVFEKYKTIAKDGKNTILSRYYFPFRRKESNPFIFMGGYETDFKMTLVGTYQSNKKHASRITIFATSDGGREWYAKYDFADEGQYDFKQGDDSWGLNFGNQIDTSDCHDCDTSHLICVQKKLNHDSESLFLAGEPIYIKKLICGKETIVETIDEHKLKTGNIIALKSELDSKDSISFLLNNSFNNNDAGNGIFYKIKVIDSHRFYIFESISNPFINVACRHIHHINREKDGFSVGTGEIFPNGWLFYFQIKEADTYSRVKASDDFAIVKLNKSFHSVQRTMGTHIYDDADNTIVFASNHDLLDRDIFVDKISRGSTGIYIGKLQDIDNFKNFSILKETKEPAYFFKLLSNNFVYSGQRGEFMIGFNQGQNWKEYVLPEPLIHLNGSTMDFYVIDNYLLRFKR